MSERIGNFVTTLKNWEGLRLTVDGRTIEITLEPLESSNRRRLSVRAPTSVRIQRLNSQGEVEGKKNDQA